MNVFEEEGVVEYLQARKIAQQYLKAKRYLEMGYFGQVDLRKRKPKTEGIYYFKITKNIALWAISRINKHLLLSKSPIISSSGDEF